MLNILLLLFSIFSIVYLQANSDIRAKQPNSVIRVLGHGTIKVVGSGTKWNSPKPNDRRWSN